MGDRLGLPGAVYTRGAQLNHVNQMARLTDFELDVKRTSMDVGAVSMRRDPKKSITWSTWHIYKAMNDIMNDNRPC